ncbi:MAG: hypothetical protein ACRC8M_04610 [Cetobacterium sp.]|uniref:hypothetical protein n=1 Tax=Cetobacterium sp. TaxID=2071632 RepID=UPI003F312F82
MKKNKVSASILQSMREKVETRKDLKEVVLEYKSIINYSEYELESTDIEKIIKCEEKVVSSAQSLKKDLLDLAEGLAEAQKLFANNKSGTFQKWFESLGLKKTFVYTLLNRQELYLEFNDEKVFQVPERVLPEIKRIKQNISPEEVRRIINSDKPLEEVKNISFGSRTIKMPNSKNDGIEEIEIIDNGGDRIKELENKLAEYYRKIKDIEYELSILRKKR